MREELALSMTRGGVTVESHVEAACEWVREMVAPAFAEIDQSQSGATVIIRSSPGTGRSMPTDELLPCFALDHQLVFLPGRRTDSSLVLNDSAVGVRYDVHRDRVEVRPLGLAPDLRIGTFRVVRELAMVQALGADRLQLHAAGIAYGPGVVLLAGPRNAGKTTTLAHLAVTTGADIVANDRVLVERLDGSWQATGVPTIVSIRPDTMVRLPHAFAGQAAASRTVHLTLDEARAAPESRRLSPSGRGAMSLAQLAAAVGVPLRRGGRLSCVAILRVDETVGTFVQRPLGADEAMARLETARFGALTEPRPRTVFERWLGCDHDPSREQDLMHTLARTMSCVEVRVGPGLLRSERAGQALLQALLDAPSPPAPSS